MFIRTLICICLLAPFISNTCSAQSLYFRWTEAPPGGTVRSMYTLPDGEVVFHGTEQSSHSITRIDSDGDLDWSGDYFINNGTFANTSVRAGGQFQDTLFAYSHLNRFFEIDAITGSQLGNFQIQHPSSFPNSLRDLIRLSDGNLLLLGEVNALGSRLQILIKVHPNGTIAWQNSYHVGYWSIGQYLMEDHDGNLLSAGSNLDVNLTSYPMIMKTSANGSFAWTMDLLVPVGTSSMGGIQEISSAYLVELNLSGGGTIITAIEKDGTAVKWAREFPAASRIAVGKDESIMVFSQLQFPDYKNFITRLDSNGSVVMQVNPQPFFYLTEDWFKASGCNEYAVMGLHIDSSSNRYNVACRFDNAGNGFCNYGNDTISVVNRTVTYSRSTIQLPYSLAPFTISAATPISLPLPRTPVDSLFCRTNFCLDSTNWTVAFSQSITGMNAAFTHTAGPAVSWEWDFGDGNGSTLQNPAHNYNAFGSYLVCLSITDSTCCVQTLCDSVIVGCPDSTTWTVAFSQVSNGPMVNFTHTQGSAVTWNWDFGDGNSSSLQNPAHNYSTLGSYLVCLSIMDSLSCQQTYCDTVTVDCPDSTTWTVAFSQVSNGPTVDFTHTQGSATAWNWDFGDGNSSTLQNPSHSYTTSGTYTVCLTITNSLNCQETICDTVNVIVIGLDQTLHGGAVDLRHLTNGKYQINWAGMPQADSQIKICDVYGKILASFRVSGSVGELAFDLNSLSAGVYWLSFENEAIRDVQKLAKW